MFMKIYLWIRKYLMGIDDRSSVEIAIVNGFQKKQQDLSNNKNGDKKRVLERKNDLDKKIICE